MHFNSPGEEDKFVDLFSPPFASSVDCIVCRTPIVRLRKRVRDGRFKNFRKRDVHLKQCPAIDGIAKPAGRAVRLQIIHSFE